MNAAHVGKVVDGRYRLDRLLGEGAAGAVYEATQLSVDRIVAVKLLHQADSDRFAAEAKAIAKLNHTNVITLHDFGFDQALGAHFMVTEFAEGIPLSERMQEVMSTELILRVSLEVASALHHAHANGVLHRDLKPENVVLTRADGRVDVAKVLDFGLVHLMSKSEPSAFDSSELPEPGGATSLINLATFGVDVPSTPATSSSEFPAAGAATAVMDREPWITDHAPKAADPDPEPAPPEEPPGPLETAQDEDDEFASTTSMKAVNVDTAVLAAAQLPRMAEEAATDEGESATAVLPPLDLSVDSVFGEEEE